MDILVKKPNGNFPRYVCGKLPSFRAKKKLDSNSSFNKEYKELYGDGDWMFSFKTDFKIDEKYRVALYLS